MSSPSEDPKSELGEKSPTTEAGAGLPTGSAANSGTALNELADPSQVKAEGLGGTTSAVSSGASLHKVEDDPGSGKRMKGPVIIGALAVIAVALLLIALLSRGGGGGSTPPPPTASCPTGTSEDGLGESFVDDESGLQCSCPYTGHRVEMSSDGSVECSCLGLLQENGVTKACGCWGEAGSENENIQVAWGSLCEGTLVTLDGYDGNDTVFDSDEFAAGIADLLPTIVVDPENQVLLEDPETLEPIDGQWDAFDDGEEANSLRGTSSEGVQAVLTVLPDPSSPGDTDTPQRARRALEELSTGLSPRLTDLGIVGLRFNGTSNLELPAPCPGLCGKVGLCNSGSGTCTCPPGFGGRLCRCQDDVDCSGHGTCTSTGVNGCLCESGFFGPRCEQTLPRLLSSSPANGDTGVALTRETVFLLSDDFTGPYWNGSDAGNPALSPVQVQVGGQDLDVVLRRGGGLNALWLFYPDGLPAQSRVNVKLNGDLLLAPTGQAMDVDDDGVPGGVKTVSFDTLSVARAVNTRLCGRIFASTVSMENGTTINTPLANVLVDVDGAEDELRAFSDPHGCFCLDPAPAGRFFVHIRGNTTTTPHPPGSYYPTVGKSWTSQVGQEVSIGEVYLPLIAPDTLVEVSEDNDTIIEFPEAVSEAFPQFAGVRLTVPAGALFDGVTGQRGGRVGIAPVPPDRLPGTLPPGLNPNLVVTVQTDGPTNFDSPVSICFPLSAMNGTELVEDENGAVSALYSFNHDTGEFEIVAPMVLSADGTEVCTLEGQGIQAPGWHLPDPGSGGGPPPPPPPCPLCGPPGPPPGPPPPPPPPCGSLCNPPPGPPPSPPPFPPWWPGSPPNPGLPGPWGPPWYGGAVVVWPPPGVCPCYPPPDPPEPPPTGGGIGTPPSLTVVVDPQPGVVVEWPQSILGEPITCPDFVPEDCGGPASKAVMKYCYVTKFTGLAFVNALSAAMTSNADVVCAILDEAPEMTGALEEALGRFGEQLRLPTGAQNLDDVRALCEGPSWVGGAGSGWLPPVAGLGGYNPSGLLLREVLTWEGCVEHVTDCLSAYCGSSRGSVRGVSEPLSESSIAGYESALSALKEAIVVFKELPSVVDALAEEYPARAMSAAGIDFGLSNGNVSQDVVDAVAKFVTLFGGQRPHQRLGQMMSRVDPVYLAAQERDNLEPRAESGGGVGRELYFAVLAPIPGTDAGAGAEFEVLGRGKTGDSGIVPGSFFRPNSLHVVGLLDGVSLAWSIAPFYTPGNGVRFTLPQGGLREFERGMWPDTDWDGLDEIAELIVGTSNFNNDTDGDGQSDFDEVRNGEDPLSGFIASTGVAGSVGVPGEAVDLCVQDNLAVVVFSTETGSGVIVYNVFNRLSPLAVFQSALPGVARRVVCGPSRAVVLFEDAESGLVVLDLDGGGSLRTLTPFPGVRVLGAVLLSSNRAYVGTETGLVAQIDLGSGAVIEEEEVVGEGVAVEAVGTGGGRLFAFSGGKVASWSLWPATGNIRERKGTAELPASQFLNYGIARMFVGSNRVWVNTRLTLVPVDVNGDVLSSPTPIQQVFPNPVGWGNVVELGNNLVCAAFGPGDTDISLWSAEPFEILGTFQLPDDGSSVNADGKSRAVASFNGVVYAINPEGLQIVNVLDLDVDGIPPQADLIVSSDVEGNRVQQGGVVRLSVDAVDDVGIRNVVFLVDDIPVFTDGTFPFEYSHDIPGGEGAIGSFLNFSAIVTDTGGNSNTTDSRGWEVVADATGPRLESVFPLAGHIVRPGTVAGVVMTFTEGVKGLTGTIAVEGESPVPLDAYGWRVGGGGEETFSLWETAAPGELLPEGNYTITITGGTDAAGNSIADDSHPLEWSWQMGGVRTFLCANGSEGAISTPECWDPPRLPTEFDLVHVPEGCMSVNSSTLTVFGVTGSCLIVDGGSVEAIGGTGEGGVIDMVNVTVSIGSGSASIWVVDQLIVGSDGIWATTDPPTPAFGSIDVLEMYEGSVADGSELGGNVRISERFHWFGGSIRGAGKIFIGPQALFLVDGDDLMVIERRQVIAEAGGVVDLRSGSLRLTQSGGVGELGRGPLDSGAFNETCIDSRPPSVYATQPASGTSAPGGLEVVRVGFTDPDVELVCGNDSVVVDGYNGTVALDLTDGVLHVVFSPGLDAGTWSVVLVAECFVESDSGLALGSDYAFEFTTGRVWRWGVGEVWEVGPPSGSTNLDTVIGEADLELSGSFARVIMSSGTTLSVTGSDLSVGSTPSIAGVVSVDQLLVEDATLDVEGVVSAASDVSVLEGGRIDTSTGSWAPVRSSVSGTLLLNSTSGFVLAGTGQWDVSNVAWVSGVVSGSSDAAFFLRSGAQVTLGVDGVTCNDAQHRLNNWDLYGEYAGTCVDSSGWSLLQIQGSDVEGLGFC